MKASVKFREDQKPLVRGKIPLSILGFPFSSGFSAGDSKELSLQLGTSNSAGPVVKFVYKPNDSWKPFSLVMRTGIGAWGSPINSPMAMSAELNLLTNGAPSFFLRFNPQIGDFFSKTSSRSPLVLNCNYSPEFARKMVEDSSGNQETPKANGSYTLDSPDSLRKVTFPAIFPISELFSGVELGVRSSLPLRRNAVINVRWGVKLPSNLMENSSIALRNVPCITLNKVGIEHVEREEKKKEDGDLRAKISREFLPENQIRGLVMQELEALKLENRSLKKAVEDIRAEVIAGKHGSFGWKMDSGGYRDEGKKGARHFQAKKASENGVMVSGKLGEDGVEEELKKALKGASRV
ncbi:uncharacterized protein LOC18439792 [Amborella trichopoda]|uniref:Uncharacterized protein n=1 Tax=Amborella trichopoda TaxID=13333 RepID=W1PUU0_AMBTC|nr:uncharacterized protein LOC18439792 [Amborella trichopoda]ERN11594.1 hypothetical protein AMTR_s00022p00182240 [Amborella trichopoda]|eukprot:XP_006850013.1 uncharacterized protein LOC18439792 [Amborella trichopoda]